MISEEVTRTCQLTLSRCGQQGAILSISHWFWEDAYLAFYPTLLRWPAEFFPCSLVVWNVVLREADHKTSHAYTLPLLNRFYRPRQIQPPSIDEGVVQGLRTTTC